MTKVICKCAAVLVLLLLAALPCSAQLAHAYQYFRVGNAVDAQVKPQAGYALKGGGADLDEAFVWLCARANGGDLLVLRATGTDAYNAYIQKLCHLNSVATLVIPNREAANDPFAEKTIRSASAIFISGGDQANYINFWMKSSVQTALNDAIARGMPIGGTSAGLAVMGEYAYSAQGDKPGDPDLDSKMAIANPDGPRVTLVRGFLDIPVLKSVITDTHFAKRDRMGRLLAFLARVNSANPSGAPSVRGIGVEQGAAVLLEPGGEATVVGHGDAYFIERDYEVKAYTIARQLTLFAPSTIQRIAPGHSFNLKTWTGNATKYSLSVKDDVIHSTQAGGAIY